MKGKVSFWISGLFLGILTIWLAYPMIIQSAFNRGMLLSSDWQNLGVFGDSFGALNTLFSGLAFAGVVVNIVQQRRELSEIARKEENTSSLLSKQIRLSALTAALNYHNSDADRLQEIAKLVRDGDGPMNDMMKIAVITTHGTNTKERNELLKEIEKLLSETST